MWGTWGAAGGQGVCVYCRGRAQGARLQGLHTRTCSFSCCCCPEGVKFVPGEKGQPHPYPGLCPSPCRSCPQLCLAEPGASSCRAARGGDQADGWEGLQVGLMSYRGVGWWGRGIRVSLSYAQGHPDPSPTPHWEGIPQQLPAAWLWEPAQGVGRLRGPCPASTSPAVPDNTAQAPSHQPQPRRAGGARDALTVQCFPSIPRH